MAGIKNVSFSAAWCLYPVRPKCFIYRGVEDIWLLPMEGGCFCWGSVLGLNAEKPKEKGAVMGKGEKFCCVCALAWVWKQHKGWCLPECFLLWYFCSWGGGMHCLLHPSAWGTGCKNNPELSAVRGADRGGGICRVLPAGFCGMLLLVPEALRVVWERCSYQRSRAPLKKGCTPDTPG